ncbi:SLBB domain-containing protein [Dysgonomonas sp. 25]|uniref:SLBB domain-containing protein n=1 Tax=Dysgonomonas sp. 25 TaxID=2302933 RepID=UPI0013D35E84|nr:SLBB domain-containing protein [Dysgonomonas sp. 25]NDV69010.1 capsule biosynthesis protein [Dysgonomonas sp. 25]
MKRLILLSFILFLSATFLQAQMSDSQVLQYVQSEMAKGTSQQVIGIELTKRGVTQSQVERIKKQVEKEKAKGGTSVSSTSAQSRAHTLPANMQKVDSLNYPSAAQMANQKGITGREIFGKNIFNQKNLSFTPSANLPTPENYILGPGDEVIIDIWGASQVTFRETISPEGDIVIDRIGPVHLNGMSIKAANAYVQQKFSSVYSGVSGMDDTNMGGASQIKLTLGQIRTIQIDVMGEVVTPGTYSLSSLSSVFHALYTAGGVNDIGSMREIQLYRNGKLVESVDIYQHIMYGKSSGNIRLSDGDIIIVPPYISLVGISGKVKRPMFYEMNSDETITDLINYAGGFTGDAYLDEITLNRKTGGYNKVFTLPSTDFGNFILQDEDSITVGTGLNLYENEAVVMGAVFRPGSYGIGGDIKTIKELIDKAGGLKEDAFVNRAVLSREKDDLTREVVAINLANLLSGKSSDIVLRKNDTLNIAFNTVLLDLGNLEIFGEVNYPGTYSYGEKTSIEDLIIMAGGLKGSASTVKVDVSRRIINPASTEASNQIAKIFTFEMKNGLIVDGNSEFELKPYDQVFVRRSPGYIEQRNVILDGEVLFPGAYALEEKDERLSDVVRRAGNLTKYAYTQGARLVRTRTEEELAQYRKTMQDIAARNAKDSISDELAEFEKYYAVGIELDKAIANPRSEYDLVLKPGDKLIIPEYDNTITIIGEVMYPNTVLYKKGEKVSYYIDLAGGYSDQAQKKKAYIVYMNGRVTKVKGSNKDAIQPGCSIIVPSKEKRNRMSVGEMVSIGTSVTSMASVVALLINSLTN